MKAIATCSARFAYCDCRTPMHHKDSALKVCRQNIKKIALKDLGEATVAHLSEDRLSLRDSVVEKTVTNHLVYYYAILLWENL